MKIPNLHLHHNTCEAQYLFHQNLTSCLPPSFQYCFNQRLTLFYFGFLYQIFVLFICHGKPTALNNIIVPYTCSILNSSCEAGHSGTSIVQSSHKTFVSSLSLTVFIAKYFSRAKPKYLNHLIRCITPFL